MGRQEMISSIFFQGIGDLFGTNLLKKFIFAQNLEIMIQRIQTIFLLISTLLVGLLFLLPFAEIAKDGAVYLFNFKGIILDGTVKESGVFVSILIGIILALHVYGISSFKKRIMQIRIIVFAILLLIGLCGMFSFYTYYSFSGANISLKISALFPVVAIILDYLAIRAIGKDEALIRSIDRIR
jgi:hypothetical protein